MLILIFCLCGAMLGARVRAQTSSQRVSGDDSKMVDRIVSFNTQESTRWPVSRTLAKFLGSDCTSCWYECRQIPGNARKTRLCANTWIREWFGFFLLQCGRNSQTGSILRTHFDRLAGYGWVGSTTLLAESRAFVQSKLVRLSLFHRGVNWLFHWPNGVIFEGSVDWERSLPCWAFSGRLPGFSICAEVSRASLQTRTCISRRISGKTFQCTACERNAHLAAFDWHSMEFECHSPDAGEIREWPSICRYRRIL